VTTKLAGQLPRLVVMPGLDGTGLLLQNFAQEMARHCPTEVLRYPGDMSCYADLAPWVRARVPDDPHVLLAESFSGPLALTVASEAPQGLLGVIFITSFIRAPMAVPPMVAEVLRGLPIDSPAALKLLEPFTIGANAAPDVMETFRRALQEVPHATLADRLAEVLRADGRAALDRLTLPHACVVATGDRLVPTARARELCHRACHVERMEGPHFLMQTRPADAARAVAACMAEIVARSQAEG